MPNALDRTFGFELEVANEAGALASALNRRGLSNGDRLHDWHCRCRTCGMHFGQWRNWLKVQHDSSCGGEVISSILRWGDNSDIDSGESNVDPNIIIEQLTETLVENDTPIDNRCGLHVHVGARDLSDSQLGRLYALMHHHEAILYRLACGRSPTHRGYSNEFNYCRPMSAFNNPVELKELALLKSAQVKSSPIAHNKYVAANLMPIETLGTVEFRLWESTRSLRRLRLYTKLSVALVERARRRRNPSGPALDLGEQADDSVFATFLADLQDTVPELVDGQFITDAWWQWNEGPARWQERVTLPPLPHHTMDGTLATSEEDVDLVVERYDSHGRPVTVPPQYDLEREARERAAQERARQFYRTRPIPIHMRDAAESGVNYDCGEGRCANAICETNRTSFWGGVERNHVRPPTNPPQPAAPTITNTFTFNERATRLAARRARITPSPEPRMETMEDPGWTSYSPFPVDEPIELEDEPMYTERGQV